jgi:hypothetical protein
MRIDQLADRLARAGDRVTGGAATLADHDPGAGVFGADAPGRLGELGRLLHHRLGAALTARARESAAHGARLTDAADLLHGAADRYRDAETGASGRHDIEVG